MRLDVPASLVEWSGAVIVPDLHAFTGPHFDTWRQLFEAVNLTTNETRAFAYTFAQFAAKHGSFDITRHALTEDGQRTGESEPFTIQELESWLTNVGKEKFHLIGWLNLRGRIYFRELTAPFG